MRSEAQKQGKQIQKQVPFHGGDDIGDLKEQLAEVKQSLDSVVNEVWKMKMQTSAWPLGDVRLRQDNVSEPRQDLGHRKWQIVLDLFVVVGVLVGALLGLVVAQMFK